MLFAVQDLTPTCNYLLTITRYGLVQGIHSCQIAQVNKLLGLYVAMLTASGPTTPSTMSYVGPGVDNDTRISSSNQDCLPLIPPRQPKPNNTGMITVTISITFTIAVYNPSSNTNEMQQG